MADEKATADQLLDQVLKSGETPTSIKDLLKRRGQPQEKQAQESIIPQRIDTLRQDFSCPIDLGAQCGLESPEPGEECEVCGYKVPSASMDDPDLTKARRIREKMRLQDEERQRSRLGWEEA